VGDPDQSSALGIVEHPAERVVQGRHRKDGADPASPAQLFEGIEIRPGPGHRQGRQFQPKGAREHDEPGIGDSVHRDDIAGLEQGHRRHRETVLSAVDDQDSVAADVESPPAQVVSDRGPVLDAPARWLIAQERVEVAGSGEIPQGLAQQLGLAGNRGELKLRSMASTATVRWSISSPVAAARSRTNVPRPCSELTSPIASSSAYTREAVTTAIPLSAASLRWMGRRWPPGHRPPRICAASESTTPLYFGTLTVALYA
jgi:hypothetical protein